MAHETPLPHRDADQAEAALADERTITAYAYARTGYHRGLDQLRRQGWRGFGPVPYSHENNRGFLRAVAALARAAHREGGGAMAATTSSTVMVSRLWRTARIALRNG